MGRVFANGPGDLGSIPSRVIPKTFKMVLDTSLLNTQQYKVRIKGKVMRSREMSSAFSYTYLIMLGWKIPRSRRKIPRVIFQKDAFLLLLFVKAMMSLNYIFRNVLRATNWQNNQSRLIILCIWTTSSILQKMKKRPWYKQQECTAWI